MLGIGLVMAALAVGPVIASSASALHDGAFPDLPSPPALDGLVGLPPSPLPGRSAFLERLTRAAEDLGLPPAVADAVAFVESAYRADARGAAGEVGLMQVMPATAAMLGHRGNLQELAQPDVNIRYGVLYLAQAWRIAGGDLCRTLMKYRAGHGEEQMTPLSIRYCARARAHLAAIGSPLAESAVPASVANLERPTPSTERIGRDAPVPLVRASRVGKIRTAADSRRFWAAHEARIRAATARLASRDRKTMQN